VPERRRSIPQDAQAHTAVNFLRRWQAKHLLLAWIVYWIALIAVGLHAAIGAALGAVNAPSGHGTIGLSVDGGNLHMKVTTDDRVWTGTTSLMAAALWFAGPPLLLFLVWLVTRRAPVAAPDPERDYRIS
jgi:hypothetical protein